MERDDDRDDAVCDVVADALSQAVESYARDRGLDLAYVAIVVEDDEVSFRSNGREEDLVRLLREIALDLELRISARN